MISIVIDTPLNFHSIVRRICGNHRISPVVTGLVIVDTDSGIVSTWPTSTDLGGFKVGPRGYWLEDGAFGAGIDAGLLKLVLFEEIHRSGEGVIPQIQAEYDLKEWSSIRERSPGKADMTATKEM